MRKRYEERQNEARAEPEEESSDSSSDEKSEEPGSSDPPPEEQKQSRPSVQPIVHKPLAFKLDLSRCHFGVSKESPVEIELSTEI